MSLAQQNHRTERRKTHRKPARNKHYGIPHRFCSLVARLLVSVLSLPGLLQSIAKMSGVSSLAAGLPSLSLVDNAPLSRLIQEDGRPKRLCLKARVLSWTKQAWAGLRGHLRQWLLHETEHSANKWTQERPAELSSPVSNLPRLTKNELSGSPSHWLQTKKLPDTWT